MFDIHKCRHADCETISGTLLTDSQDVEAVLDSIGCNLLDITGAIVTVADGDYSDVWLTQSSRPYDIHAIYFKVI